MKHNLFAVDPYSRACCIVTQQACDCEHVDRRKPRVMQFVRGVVRCQRCAEEFVPSECAATRSTLCSITSECVKSLGANIDKSKLEHIIEVMPFEDMMHVVFAAAHHAYQLSFGYMLLENVMDLDILDDVVAASQTRTTCDEIVSPLKRRRNDDDL